MRQDCWDGTELPQLDRNSTTVPSSGREEAPLHAGVFGPKAQQFETWYYEEGCRNNRPEEEEGERLESREKIEYID